MRMINADNARESLLGDVICESCNQPHVMNNCVYIMCMKNLRKIFICSKCFKSEAPEEFVNKLQLDTEIKK